MAQNNEEEDYKMELYEVRQENAELRRKLEEKKTNDSIALKNPSDTGTNSSEISLSSSMSSLRDQVTTALAIITQKMNDNFKELSARVEETSKNYQQSQAWMEERIRDNNDVMKDMELIIKAMTNETNVQNTLYNSVNCLVKENIEASKILKNKINIILEKRIQILVIGGVDDSNNFCSNIFLLDYNDKTWKRVSIELPYKLSDNGTAILNDELYIIGGRKDGTVCNILYRLNKLMEWEKLTDMQLGRAYITNSCVSHNGCIWVIGGLSNSSVYTNTIEKYDPSTNRWENKPAMKFQRGYAAAAIIKKKIYVCGGYNGAFLNCVEVFDINSEVWNVFFTLPELRGQLSIIVNGTNIFLIGGYNKGKENTVWKMDVEETNKKWENLSPLNEGRFNFSAVRLETGCILAFGGYTSKSVNSVEIISGEKWESFTPLPQPRSSHSSVVLTPAMIAAFHSHVI